MGPTELEAWEDTTNTKHKQVSETTALPEHLSYQSGLKIPTFSLIH